MSTAMEQAFRRAIGTPEIPHQIEEKPDSPKQVEIVVNNMRYTLAELLSRSDIPLGDVDIRIANNASPYIALPKREYRILDGMIIHGTSERSRKILGADGFVPRGHEEIEALDRELVVILKGKKDLFDKNSFAVKHMRNTLLSLCANSHKRSYLMRQRESAMELGNIIDQAHRTGASVTELESRSREFYESTVRALELSQLDLSVIRALSWEWKDRAIFRTHPYTCRSWIIIACIFSLVR